MIDWWGLGTNSLWVAGLAIGLAAFSMAHYRARAERVRLRQELQELGTMLPFCIGMMLCGWGLLLSTDHWWEQIGGGLLAVAFMVWSFLLWKQWRTNLPRS